MNLIPLLDDYKRYFFEQPFWIEEADITLLIEEAENGSG